MKRPTSTLKGGQGGFTLLEVLVAVAITALIGVGIWQVMSGVIKARTTVDTVSERFEKLQRAMLLIERDIVQVVNRPIRGAYGDKQFALTSLGDTYLLQLTRQGWRNPLDDPRSELQRVAYSLEGQTLHRWQWQVLDRAQDSKPVDQSLLDNVISVKVRFMNQAGNWVDQWPEEVPGQAPPKPETASLPRAIELTLELKRFGRIKRVWVLPDFDAATVKKTQTGQGNAAQNGAGAQGQAAGGGGG